MATFAETMLAKYEMLLQTSAGRDHVFMTDSISMRTTIAHAGSAHGKSATLSNRRIAQRGITQSRWTTTQVPRSWNRNTPLTSFMSARSSALRFIAT